jgi:hypothetical protein
MTLSLLSVRRLLQMASLALLVFISGVSLQAQITTGTVRGEVRDQTGAAPLSLQGLCLRSRLKQIA